MRFILKSILAFLIILSIYQWIIPTSLAKSEISYQSWWQENKVKAQQFVFSEDTISQVLVGSSLSANLHLKKGQPFIYNLSFIGGGSLTGLEIIKKSNKLPDTLLIEMNWVDRNIDQAMVNQLFHPLGSLITTQFTALQEINQPVNHIGNLLQEQINIAPINTELHLNDQQFNLAINRNAQNDNDVDSLNLTQYLHQIKKYVAYFTRKKIKVYYLFIPVHPQIQASKKYQIIGNFLKQQKEEFIGSLGNQALKTTDGYHFNQESAAVYSAALNNRLKK